MPDVIDLTARQRHEHAPRDLEWVLNAVGPTFSDTPANTDIFDRLDLFGRLIHKVESVSQREAARQIWVDWLDQNARVIAQPARVVQRAIDAGRQSADGDGKSLRWYTIPELAELEPTKPLVGDIVMQESLAVLYGPAGGGKTFLALDLALSIAADCDWHGRDVVAGPVACILAEGRGGIQRRIDAWLQAHGLSGDIPFRLLLEPVDFLRRPDVTELLTSFEEWDPAPRLVVVDTLSQCMPGAVENAQEDMSTFTNAAGQLRRTTGATVLSNHHSGWEGRHERGSTVLRGAVDTVMKVVEEDGVITLSCEKQRDAVPFGPIWFRLSPRGQSCTVELAGPEIHGELTPSALEALRALENIAAADGVTGPTWLEQCDQAKRTFYRSIKQLQDDGCIEKCGSRYGVTTHGHALLHGDSVPKNGGTGTPQCHPIRVSVPRVPRLSWHWMAKKTQRKRKTMTQCHSSATLWHSAGSASATPRGGLVRPPVALPGTWHLSTHGERGTTPTGYAIPCGVGSDGVTKSYGAAVPGVCPHWLPEGNGGNSKTMTAVSEWFPTPENLWPFDSLTGRVAGRASGRPGRGSILRSSSAPCGQTCERFARSAIFALRPILMYKDR